MNRQSHRLRKTTTLPTTPPPASPPPDPSDLPIPSSDELDEQESRSSSSLPFWHPKAICHVIRALVA